MKYQDLYESIKQDILNQRYHYQEKLPSIREMSAIKHVSRTTVEAAYNQLLLEGYITAKNKIGYFVDVNNVEKSNHELMQKTIGEQHKDYLYDFSGTSVDMHIFEMKLWKKYIKETFDEPSLYSYGDYQGEERLRIALTKYASLYRGVEASYDQMVLGSGFQSLLTILLGILKVQKVGMPASGFIHAQRIFEDFRMEVVFIEEDDDGILLSSLEKADIQLLYIYPSKVGTQAKPLSYNRKRELASYASRHDLYIIEDDHNGELRYINRPIEAMQPMERDRIIYIGSFSKLLIPSLRIAYMVLPEPLLTIYEKHKNQYHQTISKFEQIAFTHYIEDGQLIRQLKKSRRIYARKCQFMISCIKEYLPEYTYIIEETALRIKIFCIYDIDVLNEHSINAIPYLDGVGLSFSGIEEKCMLEGIKELSKYIKKDPH